MILLGIADISDRKQVEQQHGLTVALEKQMSERTEELEQVHRSLSRDMAERRRLEDQLRQAQKMESIGTLAAGVARDAMPDSGRLALKTRLVHCSELQEHGDLTAEEYVSIEVADTGTGMDENVQSRIFEPFFTTKENGHGTGLGLAVVYGIVKSHNGLIQVKSQPMQGTTFHVYFPVASSEE